MKRTARCLSLLLCLTFLPGCFTALWRNDSVEVTSNVDGVRVVLDGKNVGTTPCEVDVSRGSDHVFQFYKDGYAKEEIEFNRVGASKWQTLQFFMFFPGWLVDTVTGYCKKFPSDGVYADMEKK